MRKSVVALLTLLVLPLAVATGCGPAASGTGDGVDGGRTDGGRTGDGAATDGPRRLDGPRSDGPRPGRDARLNSDAMPGGCGDGVLQPPEVCDDLNNASGDGCAADCAMIERDFACPMPGQACVTTVVCGDGRISGAETCDDSNMRAGDGCTLGCQIEPGWICPQAGRACEAARCGDGIIAGAEECEDGDMPPAGMDGCSDTCRVEPGFVCPTPGQACRTTTCNDGVKEGSEPCDDGNAVIGDGCNPFCEVEPSCPMGACTSRCGDGLILPSDNESCDDGNTRAGDGCSMACTLEAGYACTNVPSQLPQVLSVAVKYRDFVALPMGGSARHPTSEIFSGVERTPGLVAAMLGADGKPVHTGICDGTRTYPNAACPYGQETTSQVNFDQWYRDVAGVNVPRVTRMDLQRQANGAYFFPDSTFFPLDGMGFVAMGLEALSMGHNFGFTSELRYWFEFKGNEELLFSGDDDVWVFINGRLAVDIGGLHPQRPGSVRLNPATATALALEVGRVYEIVLFHAERRTDASNFNLTLSGFTSARSTCTTRCGDAVVAGAEQCDDGRNDGSYGSCTADCHRGPFCGDGTQQMPQEECDDGVNVTTYSASGQPACAPGCRRSGYCGDTRVDAIFGEQCDDGMNTGGYGRCKMGCLLDIRCGDGTVQAAQGETCDDGNMVGGDGCNAMCREEIVGAL